MMQKRPNFFIVGAPKSGTTALYEYLRHHPGIFMPEKKEPHYFATDFVHFPRIQEEEEYLQLFSGCSDTHSAVGEASAAYLFSDTAVKNIYAFNPGAKIIAMLRNPVDLVYSMHAQALYNFNEDEPDFEKAWALQGERQQGRHIPPGCRAGQLLQYQALGSLGEQVKRLYSIFPRSQVLIIFFDDFLADTRSAYEEVLKFLELPTDGRTNFDPVNISKTHKSKILGWLTQTPPKPVISIVRFLRKRLGIDIYRPLAWARRLNDRAAGREPLDPEFRDHLQEVFRDDIRLLEEQTGKNLDHWLA
jgi:hypothetical protein